MAKVSLNVKTHFLQHKKDNLMSEMSATKTIDYLTLSLNLQPSAPASRHHMSV